MNDLKFLNALNIIPGVGSAVLRSLKNHFGTYEAAWQADDGAFKNAAIPDQAIEAIIWKRKSIQPDRELEKLVKEQIWLVDDNDENYPAGLREISSPPIMLYGKGRLSPAENMIGIVGSRKPTAYGLEATSAIACKLAETGIGIVSGLAQGIDGRAHESALDAKGYTISVLGSGVDNNSIFPGEHKGLARRIHEAGGAVISEYGPGTPAIREHFPQRNRIISGMSRGVLIIEARERSGALITARFALDQNRDVFAVPGSIFSSASRGTHGLIREGATLVTGANDILEEWGIEYNREIIDKADSTLGEKDRMLLELLEEPLTVDALKEKTKLPIHVILASLSVFELKGMIKNLGSDTFQKIV